MLSLSTLAVLGSAEGETCGWSVLKPCDWDQEVPMGWRYTAAEFQRSLEAQKQ